MQMHFRLMTHNGSFIGCVVIMSCLFPILQFSLTISFSLIFISYESSLMVYAVKRNRKDTETDTQRDTFLFSLN